MLKASNSLRVLNYCRKATALLPAENYQLKLERAPKFSIYYLLDFSFHEMKNS